MAFAMMGGIIIGTLLTLLFLPALYVAWFRVKPPTEAKAKQATSQKPRSPWLAIDHGRAWLRVRDSPERKRSDENPHMIPDAILSRFAH